MRIIVLIGFFLSLSYCADAQTVNGVPLEELDSEYISIVGMRRGFSRKVIVSLEFGQLNKIFKNSDTEILDEDGRPIILNSMIEALNFMNKFGYEFVDSLVVRNGDQNILHYLMRKKPDVN